MCVVHVCRSTAACHSSGSGKGHRRPAVRPLLLRYETRVACFRAVPCCVVQMEGSGAIFMMQHGKLEGRSARFPHTA
jgi:hypothetical protein